MFWRECEENKKKLKRILDNDKEFILFDVETTGLSARNNRIIQFSAFKVKSLDRICFEYDWIDLYIQSDSPLTEEISALTGITDETLKEKGLTEEEAVKQIVDFMRGTTLLAGYNVEFDVRFLKQMFLRQGRNIAIEKLKTLDVYQMVKDTIDTAEVENQKLENVAKYFGLDYNFHSSIEDVRATLDIINKMEELYDEAERAYRSTKRTKEFNILSVSHWKAPRKDLGRIYVAIEGSGVNGSVFFDLYHKVWREKEEGMLKLIDMDILVGKVNEIVRNMGCEDYSKFKGNYKA